MVAGTIHVDDDSRAILSGGLVVMLRGTVYFESNPELGISTAHWYPHGTATETWLPSPQRLSSWGTYSVFASWVSGQSNRFSP